MGDRAMAEVKTEGGSLFVYTHWGGYELPEDAKEAVKQAKPRWSDHAYATHIIVDQLMKSGRDSETGIGLMLGPNAEDEYNNDSPSVVIDILGQRVTIDHDKKESLTFQEIA